MSRKEPRLRVTGRGGVGGVKVLIRDVVASLRNPHLMC